ncbi:MAG: hypothetical protein APR63_08330 [Desulfuromonas sp. SDB]|nr:MAG: hypothetical protein APR63_08330 [Desulfuromonas sp. SDB]
MGSDQPSEHLIKLKSEYNELKSLVDELRDMVFKLDPRGNITFINQAAESLLSSFREDILGTSFLNYVSDKHQSNVKDSLEKVLQGENINIDIKLKNHNQVFIVFKPYYDSDQKISGVIGISQNITKQKEFETALYKSERDKEIILNNIQELVRYLDKNKKILWANKASEKISGISVIDQLGEYCYSIDFQRDRPCEQCIFDKAIKSGLPEYSYYYREDGKILSCSAYPVKDAQKNITNIVQTALDVTSEMKIQQVNEFLKQKIDKIFTYSQLVFVKLNLPDLSIVETNQKFRELTGKNHLDEQLQFDQIIDDEHRDLFHQNLKDLINNQNESFTQQLKIADKHQTSRWVELTLTKVKDDRNKEIGFGIIHDLKQQKQNEQTLKEYTQTQEILIREVNHRIKNNIMSVLSMIGYEEKKLIADESASYLESLDNLKGRIYGLISVHSLLTETGWQPINIQELFEKVIKAVLKHVFPQVEMSLNIDKTDIKVNAKQANQLSIIINELITNTVKHGIYEQKGEITVNFIHEDNYLTIIYRDHGPGFPDKILAGDYSHAGVGFDLIKGMMEKYLNGEMNLNNHHGARVTLKFLHNPP